MKIYIYIYIYIENGIIIQLLNSIYLLRVIYPIIL